ncbi:MAG: serine/threonine protein kinase [Planctomycetes bacterium]|nr:serine/threonine protein kinase [Planctomycetota bacterium]
MSEPTERAELRELVVQVIERFEEQGAAALEQLCTAHPAHATALRARIEALARLGLLDGGSAVRQRSATPPAIPTQLGDFDLQERIGAGGMGVVYLARQRSLQRLVALKLIRPDLLLFDGLDATRERFDREVAAIAKLHHPGIVPIYLVGEEAGLPYFAMEWIEGASLAALLDHLPERDPRRLHGAALVPALAAARGASHAGDPLPTLGRLAELSWIDAAVTLVHAAAEAIAHAHGRGVLHRDVKPSNLMVASDGRLLLVDFGLASTGATRRITRDGHELGSLPYLSPEQLAGGTAAVDERSDVYALGVTFYELLTLRKAYFERDAEATRRRILAGELAPPRALHPGLAADVETVCTTALDREPSRRYASAAAFAADLAALLARRPIAARPPGPLLRLRRFAQRRPTLLVGALLGGLIAAGGPALWAWQEHRRSDDLAAAARRLEIELSATQAANARAQRAAENGRRAVTEFLGRVGAELLKQVPRSEQVRRDLLEQASTLYERLLADAPDELPVRLEVAQHFRLLAMRCEEQGDHAASERAYGRAVALLEAVEHDHGEDPDWQRVLAMVLGDRGASRNNAGGASGIDTPAIERDLVRSAALLAGLARRFPGRDPQIDANAVTTATLLGDLRLRDARTAEALAAYDAALELARELHVDGRADDAAKLPLFSLRMNRIEALTQLEELGDAIVDGEELDAELAAALAKAPRQRELRFFRGQLLTRLGTVLTREERREEASAVLADAVALLDGLVADFPATPLLRHALLEALDRALDADDDAALLARAEAQAEALRAASYSGAGFRALAATTARRRAEALDRAGEHAAAGERLAAALTAALASETTSSATAEDAADNDEADDERIAPALELVAAMVARARPTAAASAERHLVQHAAAQLRAAFPASSAVRRALEKESL